MSRLTELIRQAAAKDPQLGADLEAEYKRLSQRRSFGLNFERHVPEAVELPGRPVRTGDKVRVLPERGSTKRGDKTLYRVTRIRKDESGERVASLTPHLADGDVTTVDQLVSDLVVVAEFQDPIYPGLRSTGRIERGGDKPFHTVINGENYHALEALTYTHRGRVDAIYIDPPYNTGAKDWKYNNDYVDSDDLYRHSKWLAMMERRLLVARELLKPEDSVLVVTIDEKEYLRLGLLLEQVFPEGRIQMVSVVINHRGVARSNEFTRVDEYLFFVFLGSSGPAWGADDLLSAVEEVPSTDVRWERLIKGSNGARRIDRPNLFYPVFVDPVARRVVKVGEPLPLGTNRSETRDEPGLDTVWPLGRDGSEKRWQVAPATLRRLLQDGQVRVGSSQPTDGRWSIQYFTQGQPDRIARGEIAITGRDQNGVLQLQVLSAPLRAAMSVWHRPAHNAGYYGSGLVRAMLGGRRFPFPKSLYAVEDAVRCAVGDKPDAVVLDFFAGSGTTTHAVMRLNRQDGGARQSILVTNNEVSAEEQGTLRQQGLRPGDPKWEERGICDYITKPRIAAAVTGLNPDGESVKGDYKFTDEFPMSDGFEENVEFFTLTYESPRRVSHNRDFSAIAPLLWLRAGALGSPIESVDGYAVAETYGVLEDLDQTQPFLDEVVAIESVRLVFVVTNDDRRYQMVCRQLPSHVEPVRLYESYLNNFEIVGRV